MTTKIWNKSIYKTINPDRKEHLLLLQKLKNVLTMFYLSELFFRIKPNDATQFMYL